jgi:hypothetical protein
LKRSPSQVYALVIGVGLTLAGIVGFFYSADFSTGSAVNDPANRDAVLGIFDVNGWTNVLLILTGVTGLGRAGSWFGARVYAGLNGILFLVIAALGFIAGDGDSIIGLIPVDTPGSILDLVVGALGLTAALATGSAPKPTLAPGRVEIEHVAALDHMP